MKQKLDNKKLLILSLIIVALTSAIFILSNAVNSNGKISVLITYAPGDASLLLNNQVIKKRNCTEILCTEKVNISKGSHEISIKRIDFNTESTKINIKDKSNDNIYLISTPANPAGEKYLQDNYIAQQQIQNTSSTKIDQGSVEISSKYPFLDKLNIYGGGYTIGYGASTYNMRDPASVSLYVEASNPEHRERAIEAIVSEIGVSPTDIEIIYNNFLNPFKEAE